ncbi:hypothetical protein D6817_05840 [Candidatus Pacearchaeota archaeon]|nr:MAG: hypothetical protein D6817_05840 [Candidatus Pacearchaeota archaeon]
MESQKISAINLCFELDELWLIFARVKFLRKLKTAHSTRTRRFFGASFIKCYRVQYHTRFIRQIKLT